jgi:hypothetical protein
MTRIGFRLISPLWAVIALATVASPAKADIFVFHDLTDTVTFSQLPDTPGGQLHDTVQTSFGNPFCRGESCFFDVFSNNGLTTKINLGAIAGEPNSSLGLGSDFLQASGFSIGYHLNFQSDVGPFDFCAPGANCADFTETGGVQNAPIVPVWFDANGAPVRADTIQFQSDIAEVPEPAHVVLVLLALCMFGLTLRKRLYD